VILAALAAPALADDRLKITQYEQQLSDAITNGTPAAWDKYLDANVIYVEEDDRSQLCCRCAPICLLLV
jgi:hypothetical protein